MGGDTFVPEVGGRDVEQAHGDDLRQEWVEFDQLIGEIQPFEGAHELLAEVKERGFRLVLASSSKTQHVEAFLDLIDAKSLADAWTTSDDVEHSKPEGLREPDVPDVDPAGQRPVDHRQADARGDVTSPPRSCVTGHGGRAAVPPDLVKAAAQLPRGSCRPGRLA